MLTTHCRGDLLVFEPCFTARRKGTVDGKRALAFFAVVIGTTATSSKLAQAQVSAPCNQDVTEIFANTVPDVCSWNNEAEARDAPHSDGGCSNDVNCCDDNSIDYAYQGSFASGVNACQNNQQIPGCNCGFTNDCACYLEATVFHTYTKPAGMAICKVETDVLCRYNHHQLNGVIKEDEGRIQVRVQLPGHPDWIKETTPFHNSGQDGLCKYRLEENLLDPSRNPDITNLLPTGGWDQTKIHSLQVAVKRIPDDDNGDGDIIDGPYDNAHPTNYDSNSALRVKAFRIRVTHCEDDNNDGICDYCGDGVVNPSLHEVCDGGACCTPNCSFRDSTTQCRASAGICDAAEFCTGSAAACPTDGFQAAGTPCRPAAGVCDLAETCTGSSAACPPDARVATGTECRPASGACDVAEACDGQSVACPADTVKAAGITCRPSAGNCDVAESCDGTSPQCPADAVKQAGTECRPSAGVCDLAETCTGSSAACPADARVAQGVECRPPSGACDVAEACDGQSLDCPADVVKPNGTSCSDGLFCNGLEFCQSGTCHAGTPPCDDHKSCTIDTCDEATDTCTYTPGNAACDNGLYCDGVETCNPAQGNATTGCKPGTPVDCSGLSNQCNVGVCNEATDSCQAQPVANGTICNDGLFCTVGDSCQNGICVGTPRDCSDGIGCTNDSCDETVDACVHHANDSKCDDGLFCNGRETCDPAHGNATSGCVPGSAPCTSPCTCDEAADVCNCGCPCAPCPPPSNECVVVACVGAGCNGSCVYSSVHAGAPCSSDGVTCTHDQCDGNGECVHVPDNAQCPADNNPCTDTICDSTAGCVNVSVSDGTICGIAASIDCGEPSMCANGVCVPHYRPIDTPCRDDGDPCTGDICDGLGRCIHPLLCCGDHSETIVIGDCDSGVPNKVLSNGRTMSDAICDCTRCDCIGGVCNHGTCVSCVAHLVKQWADEGLIAPPEGGKIKSCAGRGCPHEAIGCEGGGDPQTRIGDGYCDPDLDNPAYNYDGGDCAALPAGCNDEIFGDGCCDLACGDDNGDCPTNDWPGWCDPGCTNDACSYHRFYQCLPGGQALPENCLRSFDLRDFATFQQTYDGR
jgi:hypothetical protein